jgi:hypothetical protein
MGCTHEDFFANVDVNRLVADEAQPQQMTGLMADVRIHCVACGATARFRCPTVGMVMDRPAVSPMADEIHLPLFFDSDVALGLSLPGYTVKGDFDPERTN